MYSRIMYRMLLAGVAVACACAFAACEHYSDTPERQGSSVNNKTYVMPDPVPLSSSERDEVQAIKEEYYSNVEVE